MSIELGNKLRAARERVGLTQKALAELADVSQQAIQTYESGRSRPRGLVRINKLAEILKLDPAEIMPSLGEHPAGYQPDAAPGMRFTPARSEEFLAELSSTLPEALRQNVGRAFEIKGNKYRVSYLSRKVVVQAIPAPVTYSGIPPLSAIRNSLYKVALGKAVLDPTPVPDRHYLVAVVVEAGQRPLPGGLVAEAHVFDTDLEQFLNVFDLAERIVALEAAPTPLEKMFENDMGAWEPDTDFDM